MKFEYIYHMCDTTNKRCQLNEVYFSVTYVFLLLCNYNK